MIATTPSFWDEILDSSLMESRSRMLAPWASLLAPVLPVKRSTANHLVRSMVRPRNRLLDEIFYNVAESDKQQVISYGVTTQGSVIYLSPVEKEPLIFFPDVVDFLTHPRSKEVGAVSVAGVGSSAIGAVGLARDVANATGLPVAAIVSGYGLDDLTYEALGGAFFLREVNQLEFAFEQMHGLANLVARTGLLSAIETYDSVGAGPDLATAKALLRTDRLPNLRWLVGHSKGNLVISGAIGELVSENAPINLDDVKIVLFSAISALPPGIGHQAQIIGSLDALGWMNSRLNIPCKLVINAMHHLNTRLPLHINVVEELRA